MIAHPPTSVNPQFPVHDGDGPGRRRSRLPGPPVHGGQFVIRSNFSQPPMAVRLAMSGSAPAFSAAT